MIRPADLLIALVWRHISRNKEQPIEVEFVDERFGHSQMTYVQGVESSTVDSDPLSDQFPAPQRSRPLIIISWSGRGQRKIRTLARCSVFRLPNVSETPLDGPQELTGNVVASVGGTTTTINPNLKKPYADEYDISVERQFWGESSARVAYVRKNVRNDYAVLNVARVGRYTVPVTVNVNVQTFGGPATSVPYNLLDLPDKPKAVNVIDNVPDGNYMYDTLQFAFNKRFGSGLFVQGSYDYQWRNELRGTGNFTNTNTISPSGSPLNTDPIPIGFFMNPNPAVSNRQKTVNWQSRLIARYTFKYDIGVAVNLRAQSGFGYSEILTANLPNAGSTRFYAQNLDQNYADTVPILDFRFDKAIKIGRYKVTGMFDLFNSLNSNAVTNFILASGQFNRIIATLDPRTAQVAVRLDF